MTAVVELPQHLTALEHANTVRLARAQIKRAVAVGALPAAEVILNPPDCTLTMRVAELLACQRRWGAGRSRDLLAGMTISERKTVGALTERQRGVIAKALTGPTRAAA